MKLTTAGEISSYVLDILNLIHASTRLKFLVHKKELSVFTSIGAELYPGFNCVIPSEPSLSRLVKLHQEAARVDYFIQLAKIHEKHMYAHEPDTRMAGHIFAAKGWERVVPIGISFFHYLTYVEINALVVWLSSHRLLPYFGRLVTRYACLSRNHLGAKSHCKLTAICLFENCCRVLGTSLTQRDRSGSYAGRLKLPASGLPNLTMERRFQLDWKPNPRDEARNEQGA